MRNLWRLGSKKFIALIVISVAVLASALLPFLPWAVEKVSFRTIKEQLIPIYVNSGFEDTQGDKVNDWSLGNGSKITRMGGYEGNNAINMTPSTPLMVPQIIYTGKNATTSYIMGGNMVISLAAKASKPLFGANLSYLAVRTVVFHVGAYNTTAFLFNLILFKGIGNTTEGVTSNKYGVMAYKSLEESDEWYEYSIQLSKMTWAFAEYLNRWRGVYAKPTDDYRIAGLTVWCENLEALVDKVSLYLVEPKWLIATIRSNSIIPMNALISEVKINGSTPTRFYTSPDLVAPFTTFELYTFVPYIPANGSSNIVLIRFGTGQTIQFQFTEETRRIWVTF
ncbi:MAG: hypothetical protein ACUVQ8_00145 [Nitrososphaeria archaeon]